MACLYTALSGIIVSMENQANMTGLAARKSISPTGKSGLISGELAANVLFEFVLNLIAFLFMIYVLGIDMTARFPWAILTIFVSTVTGVSFGFFLGALGPKTEGGKIGMMFAIVMPCCFLSGLMIGNMRILVEQYAPWLNRINPAALISDCFYSLNVYESMDRYTGNILTLLLMSVIFCLTGVVATRRKKYASL
jgi:ABC-2 type transport system permease protein